MEIRPTPPLVLQNQRQSLQLDHDGDYAVGRETGNNLVLEDSTVSRRHGWLHVSGGDLWVQDAGSKNGTRVNGKPIEAGKWQPVAANSSVSFGNLTFQVGVAAAAAAVGGPAGVALRTGLRLDDLRSQAGKTALESEEVYTASLAGAQQALTGESGIVDLPRGVPTLVLSDLHARREFLLKAMEHKVDGQSVFDLLQAGKINVVCIGDGMHAEGRARDRWMIAEQDALASRHSQALDQEMVEGLGTMKMVMDLKGQFPENFHFVRGNHDEVKGNFAKYARVLGESAIVRNWMTETYGEDFLDRYARFEETLPLVVRGDGFVASHAAPGGRLERSQIEARDPKAFAQLAWTENRNWDDSQAEVQQRFQHNLNEVGGAGGRWLVGHRPVEDGLLRSQFGGQLIQINAPDDFVVALVPARGAEFAPGRDVFSLA